MVAVTSATLCCKSDCMGLDGRKNVPQKNSDSKATTFSKSSDISTILKSRGVTISALETQSFSLVSATKIESPVPTEKGKPAHKIQDKLSISLPQTNPQVPKFAAPMLDAVPEASTLVPTQAS